MDVDRFTENGRGRPPRAARRVERGLLGLSVAFAAGIAAGGCAPAVRSEPAIFATRAGPRLRRLWKAWGGETGACDFRGIVFDYEGEFEDGARWKGHCLVRFDRPDELWVREPRGERASAISKDAEVSGASRSPSGSEAPVWLPLLPRGNSPLPGSVSPGGEAGEANAPSPRLLATALVSLRNLMQLPWGLGGPGWSVRIALGPAGLAPSTEAEIQASRRGASEPVGPYLITCPPSSGDSVPSARTPPDRLYYALREPLPGGGRVFEVRLSNWHRVQGLFVPLRREHLRQPSAGESSPPDPLELWPEGRKPAAPSAWLRERISQPRFVTRAELDAWFPPEEGG